MEKMAASETKMDTDSNTAQDDVDMKEDETGSLKDEIIKESNNNSGEKEEVIPVPSTSKAAAAADIKATADVKNANVRIVRSTKRMRLDNDPAHTADKKDPKDDPEAEANKMFKFMKRQDAKWSIEDKNTFFKAINEYGKDFDALHSYFLVQGKKKGVPEKTIKNKEQIRHFYYRTYQKIQRKLNLKFSEDVKKTSQELYTLINYGELRRKLPRTLDKVLMKVNELIYWGSTQVRLRGKTMRIKTPICRALRKLNQLEDWQEDIKLPSKVTIELRPGNNLSWWHVQALAMNPRVRTLVPIQRRLSSILSFLQQRWKPWKPKISADIESLINSGVKSTLLLRVTPPEGCKITLPVINLGEYLTSDSVSLNSYENRLGLKSSRVELLGSMQYLKGVGKKNIKGKSKGDKRLNNNRIDEVQDNSDIDLPESKLNPTSDKVTDENNVEKPPAEQPGTSDSYPGRENISRIRQGWNVDEANTITVGDLYLMFGKDSKIVLEYWWEPPPREAAADKPNGMEMLQDNSLSLALQKLLSIAKHTYGTSKGYDNVSGSGETVISSRIPSTKESAFRRPLLPQAYHKMSAPEAFQTQLDKYKSRFARKGRMLRQRNLVVQRVLPSTPDPPPQPSYPEVQTITVGDGQTVTLTILPQTDLNNEINTNMDNGQKNFLGVLDKSTENAPKAGNSNSSVTSAMQILKEGEWYDSEIVDFSLTSFLGQLGESPVKGSQRSQAGVPMIEIIRPNSDVANMNCIMSESSVDYLDKFANFKSQIASGVDQNK